MSTIGIFVFIAIVVLWTAVRETLLDKYAYAKHPKAMRNSGLIVAGCFVSTLVLLILAG